MSATTWQVATVLVILSAPVLIGGYDLAAFLISGNKATISRVSLETSRQYPAFQWAMCFLFGLLCAHLFAHNSAGPLWPVWISLLAFVAVPLLLAFGALLVNVRTPLDEAGDLARNRPLPSVILWMTWGAVVGYFFLPQSE
jgi:hypothetical protein